jgi:hypothetical protein
MMLATFSIGAAPQVGVVDTDAGVVRDVGEFLPTDQTVVDRRKNHRRPAEDTYFPGKEVAASAAEAYRQGKRLGAHARSAGSVRCAFGTRSTSSTTRVSPSPRAWTCLRPTRIGCSSRPRPTSSSPPCMRASPSVDRRRPLRPRATRRSTICLSSAFARWFGAASGRCPAVTTASPRPRRARAPTQSALHHEGREDP